MIKLFRAADIIVFSNEMREKEIVFPIKKKIDFDKDILDYEINESSWVIDADWYCLQIYEAINKST